MESLGRKLSNLDFVYSNPSADFDRSKVKGLVAQLIRLDKKHFEASTALEICAGGKLYNVSIRRHNAQEHLLTCDDRLLLKMKLLVLNYWTKEDYDVDGL